MAHERDEPPAQDEAPLTLIRIRDPNEALGLAARLLAGQTPFRDFPLGLSVGGLISVIDNDRYAFAQRDGKAVGFVGWGLSSREIAERWAFKGYVPNPDEVSDGPCVLVFALQAISTDVTRFLVQRMRDQIFPDKLAAYFIRDYGSDTKGKPRLRAVRLVRGRARVPAATNS